MVSSTSPRPRVRTRQSDSRPERTKRPIAPTDDSSIASSRSLYGLRCAGAAPGTRKYVRSIHTGSTSASGTKRSMSIVRESSCRSSASRSASSTTTNWPFATSQPLTSSSGPTSRSCFGHQRFCLIGVRHSRWSRRNETSDCRAAGFVAGASPTGMLTSPKLTEPFQDVRICRESVVGRRGFALAPATPLDELDFGQVTTRPRTIANLWRDAMAEGRPDPAYLHEVDGEWREVTWREADEAVGELANGLLALGIERGQSFALLGRTNLEWAMFDFALAHVGAVGAPIYSSSSE